MNIYEKLMNIQSELKAPKSQFNKFGNYAYRNNEDILEALKPLLAKHKAIISLSDEITQVGDRYYVKAIARLVDAEKDNQYVEAVAYAREAESQKGMNDSQLTGSTSSYARKYALNGLFAIDDTKDSDTTNTHGKEGNNKKANQQSNAKTDTDKQALADNSLASEKQLNFIYKLVKDKNYGTESMSKYIKTAYDKDSSKALTKEEASEIIEMLNDMK